MVKLKLAEAAKMIRTTYGANPIQLFNHIRQCLATEMRLIQAANGEGVTDFPHLATNNNGAEVLQKLDVLRRRTQVRFSLIVFTRL